MRNGSIDYAALIGALGAGLLMLAGCAQPAPMTEPPPGNVLALTALDNMRFAGADDEGQLRVFDRDGVEFIDEDVTSATLRAVASTGDIIAAGGDDGRVHVYRLENDNLQQLAEFRTAAAAVRALAFQPGRDDRLAVGSDDGIIRVYDPFTGIRVGQQLVGHQPRAVLALAYGPLETSVEDWLVSAGADATFRIYEADAANSVPLRIRTAGDADINDIVFTPDGTYLITAGADGRTRVWRTEDAFDESGIPTSTWNQLRTLFGHSGAVTSATVSPDGATLITGGEDGRVILWDLETFDMVTEFVEGRNGTVTSVVTWRDGNEFAIVASGSDGSIVRESITD